MLKSFYTNTNPETLTPWTTNDPDQLGSLFPDMLTKTKKKKLKKQNLQNQPPLKPLKTLNEKQNLSQTDFLAQDDNKFQADPFTRSKVQEQQNDLNFIKKSKKSKNEHQNRELLCPKPLTTERTYLLSSNYIALEDEFNGRYQPKDQQLSRDIKNTQMCKSQHKKMTDIHSLYLIEKLKTISRTQEPLKRKALHKQYQMKNPIPFLQRLSHRDECKKQRNKALSQRNHIKQNFKTQGCQKQLKNPLYLFKKSQKEAEYFARKKTIIDTKPNCSQQSRILWAEKKDFNIQLTFGQKTSLILLPRTQAKSIKMKACDEKSDISKRFHSFQYFKADSSNIEQKFSKIQLQKQREVNQNSQKPFTIKICDKDKQKALQKMGKNSKISFIIQKSQFSTRGAQESRSINLQKQEFEENPGMKMEREVKRNLRKLRGYLVKKTRDQCMEKGNLDQNQLLMYERNVNYFPTD